MAGHATGMGLKSASTLLPVLQFQLLGLSPSFVSDHPLELLLFYVPILRRHSVQFFFLTSSLYFRPQEQEALSPTSHGTGQRNRHFPLFPILPFQFPSLIWSLWQTTCRDLSFLSVSIPWGLDRCAWQLVEPLSDPYACPCSPSPFLSTSFQYLEASSPEDPLWSQLARSQEHSIQGHIQSTHAPRHPEKTTETKEQKIHLAKTGPNISTYNYTHFKYRYLDVSLTTKSKIVKTTCLQKNPVPLKRM